MSTYSVASLWRYPVKSMAGEELDSVNVTARGLRGDRAYALVDTASGKVGSAKSVRKFGDLLKCRDIARGCYVRALKPEAQLREVVARYSLAPAARPFTRCLHCNLPLAAVDKAVIAHRLPPKVAELHQRFTYCSGCERIYWPGSHYARMCSALAKIGVRSTFRDSPTKADSPAAGKC